MHDDDDDARRRRKMTAQAQDDGCVLCTEIFSLYFQNGLAYFKKRLFLSDTDDDG